MPHRISKSLHRSSCSASFQAFVFLQLESKISFKATRYRDRHIGLKHCIQELKRRYSIRPMFLVIFLLTCTAHVSSLQISRSHLSISNRIATISTTLSLSSFDKDMTELNKLSRTELQTLSKEYGLKATLKTADLIINLEAAISSINSLEKSSLPSATDTLKFSPLEKTLTIKSTGKRTRP